MTQRPARLSWILLHSTRIIPSAPRGPGHHCLPQQCSGAVEGEARDHQGNSERAVVAGGLGSRALCDPGGPSSLWATWAGHGFPAVSLCSPPSACGPFPLPTQKCWASGEGDTLCEGWGRRETVTGDLIFPPPYPADIFLDPRSIANFQDQ